ncbi:MAG: hypothetical protein R3E97_15900 [Candidatus Eisenbacteria bacterium]
MRERDPFPRGPLSRLFTPRRSPFLVRTLTVSTCLSVLFLVGSLVGCTRERITPPEPVHEDWVRGEPRTYEVGGSPGAQVADAETDQLFEFSSGGGTFTLTPISSGPEVDVEETCFEVDYTGEGVVDLLVMQDADDFDIVLRYAPFDIAVQEGDAFEEGGWIPIAVVESAAEPVRVMLLPAAEGFVAGGPGALTATRSPTISRFKRIRIKRSDDFTVKYAQMKANVKLAVDELILAVADHRRPSVEAAVAGDLAYYVHLRERAKVGGDALPCYAPFWRDDLRWFVTCGLLMIDDSAGSVAHESGHYFHHVLVGTEAYKTFRPRPAGHKLGMPGAKEDLIETPAYFAEYYLKGLIGDPGTSNPESGQFLTASARPATANFPDLEGFPTALLASIARNDGRIRDFEGQWVDVPVVTGERESRLQQGFEIIAKGTNTVTGVLEEIRNYLFLKGEEEKLPAMLEPIGLSYHGKIRFVDENGAGVAGVAVRPISIVGDVTYRLPMNGVSSSNGEYTLPRLFPGPARLRVYHAGDSTEVTYAIDWNITTTHEIDLGTRVLGGPEPEITRTQGYDQTLVAGRSTIDLDGKHFGYDEGVVLFGDVEAAPLYSGTPNVQWGDTYIKAVIPIDAMDHTVAVRTAAGKHSEATSLTYLSIPEFVEQSKNYLIFCTANYTLTWSTPSGPRSENFTNKEIGINPYGYANLTGNGNGYTATLSSGGIDYSISTSLTFSGAKPSEYEVSAQYAYSATTAAANPDGSHDATIVTLQLRDLPLQSHEQFDFESDLANPGGFVESADITVRQYDWSEQVLVEKRLSSIEYSRLWLGGFTLR